MLGMHSEFFLRTKQIHAQPAVVSRKIAKKVWNFIVLKMPGHSLCHSNDIKKSCAEQKICQPFLSLLLHSFRIIP